MEINIIPKGHQSQQDLELQQTSGQFVAILKQLEVSTKWDKKQQSPIQVFEMDIESRVVAKGIHVLNLPFEVVFDFLKDPSFILLLNDVCQLFEVLYDNKALRVVHMIMRFPGPVSDREIVAVNTVRMEGANKAYIGNRSCNFKISQRPDTVMGNAHVSGFILERLDGNHTKITSISDIDPNGWIPAFIKNAVASKRVQFLATLQQKIREKKNIK